LDDTNSSLRKNKTFLPASKRLLLTLLYPVVLIFFMKPLAWSVYPQFSDLFLLLADPVPKAPIYPGSGFLLFGSIWSFVAVVQLKAFRKKYGNNSLKTNGIFSISPNPITLGIYCTGVGLVLILPSVVMITSLLLTIQHFHRSVKLQEYYLESVHGEVYTNYKTEGARYPR